MASHGDSDPGIVDGRDDHKDANHDHEAPHTSKFRFKSKRTSRRDERSRSPESHRDDGRHHRHHHRTKRRKRSPSAARDDDYPCFSDLPNAPSPIIDPNIAFRESLFDAMADDEGAQFWEGVYGQPIHQYPNVKEGPMGELEQMTDEEYTAYVRGKMYEKTHQHLMEEKARRDAAREERERMASEIKREEMEAKKFRIRLEESIRRGEERKNRRAWSDRWDAYIKTWEELGKGGQTKVAMASMPWPVESGKRRDISTKEVEHFFLRAPTAGIATDTQLGKILKVERIRWHPDKIQQKLGGQGIDEAVIQAVTEVFQIIDQMWSEVRDGKRE